MLRERSAPLVPDKGRLTRVPLHSPAPTGPGRIPGSTGDLSRLQASCVARNGNGRAGYGRTDPLQASLLWTGFLVTAGVGILAAWLLPLEPWLHPARRLASRLAAAPLPVVALLAGVTASLLSGLFSWQVMEFRPNLIDALAQLMHARYLAAGTFGADPDLWTAHWHVQNTLLTESGWVSHFPPGHTVILALGFLLGAPWIPAALLMGVTACFSVLIGDRLLRDQPALGRLGGLLVAVSPLLIPQAGALMNHGTAAAFGTMGIYFGLLAVDRKVWWGWAIATGLAVSLVLATRPLAGVVFAVVIAGGIWGVFISPRSGGWPSRYLRTGALRSGFAVLGGVPILAGLGWYNARFFGSALRFGYEASFGEASGLGFGRDPWGNQYGLLEAIAYTSADLTALNLNLLETPLPLVVATGVFLLGAPRLTRGVQVLVLWALLPVLANAFYWHHGYFMGPRMLAEFAPAWTLISVVAVHELLRSASDASLPGSRLSIQAGLAGTVLVAVLSAGFLAPQRVISYGGDWHRSFRQAPPPVEDQSLVFFHGSWEARLFARMATHGVRLDHVETALRQNPTCLVHQHTEALERFGPPFGEERVLPDGTSLAALDLARRTFEYEPRIEAGPGSSFRMRLGEPLPPECWREANADRLGSVDVTHLVWLGDLPGIEGGRAMYLRDLGPEQNSSILERYPERTPYLYSPLDDTGSPVLIAYDRGMARLWDEK